MRLFWGTGAAVEYVGEFALDVAITDDGSATVLPLRPVGECRVVSRASRRRGVLEPPVGPVGLEYREADASVIIVARDPHTLDPALVERGLRGHALTQNMIAAVVRRHGLAPLSPTTDAIAFDLAWGDHGRFVVAEVKSTTTINESKQLRLGLGQVLDYADLLSAVYADVVPVVVAEAEPVDERWVRLMGAHGVQLAGPKRWSRCLAQFRSRHRRAQPADRRLRRWRVGRLDATAQLACQRISDATQVCSGDFLPGSSGTLSERVTQSRLGGRMLSRAW